MHSYLSEAYVTAAISSSILNHADIFSFISLAWLHFVFKPEDKKHLIL